MSLQSLKDKAAEINSKGLPESIGGIETNIDQAEKLVVDKKPKVEKDNDKKPAVIMLKVSADLMSRITSLRIKNISNGKLPSSQSIFVELIEKQLKKEGI